MVSHHEGYSTEKEANKRHSGRLINQDQSGRIEASYITSTRMISVLFRSRVISYNWKIFGGHFNFGSLVNFITVAKFK